MEENSVSLMSFIRGGSLCFEKTFNDSGIKVEVAGAPNEVFSIEDWWKGSRNNGLFGETIKFRSIFFPKKNPGLLKMIRPGFLQSV